MVQFKHISNGTMISLKTWEKLTEEEKKNYIPIKIDKNATTIYK